MAEREGLFGAIAPHPYGASVASLPCSPRRRRVVELRLLIKTSRLLIIKKGRQLAAFLNNLAEREGFEPSIGFKAYTPLAGERLQPLGHLSGNLEAGF